MMSILIYSFIFTYIILTLFGLIGIYIHIKKKKKQTLKYDFIQLEEVTLLIPFRDEALRIKPLLNSMIHAKKLPKSIVFIDDQSVDDTSKIIRNLLSNIHYKIIQTKDPGKKNALNTGIKEVNTKYILTMDADVVFHPGYFLYLEQQKDTDMMIFPVKMSSKGYQKLFELDIYMINSLNLIADGFKRPIVASGANLLFKKAVYDEINTLSIHNHILSGDDQFLLADFNRHKKDVQIIIKNQLAIETPVPSTLKELINQRLRWIQKTPKVNDNYALFLGSIQVITTILFLLLLITTLNQKLYIQSIALILSKYFCDFFIAYHLLKSIKKKQLLPWLLIYELLLPVYTVMLGLLSLFMKPVWKKDN